MKKKYLVIGIILSLVFMGITPSSAVDNVKKSSTPIFNGNILYVGGNGTDNYTRIQDAIDNSSDGDTVYVYNDSYPYYENIVVDKSINLFGENRNTTIIDGNNSSSVIQIIVNDVVLNGFTIQNSGSGVLEYNYSGIKVLGDDNIISDNIIMSNHVGISLLKTDYNNITNNIITSNKWGIIVYNCINITIYRNVISNNYVGILTELPSLKYSSFFIKIIENDVFNNQRGVEITSQFTTILRNNFRNNSNNAFFYFWSFLNMWNGNYWNRPRLLPKPIFGYRGIIGFIPWIQFDWHPAKEPYDI